MLKKKAIQIFLIIYLASNLILSVSCPISPDWDIAGEWIISDAWGAGGPIPTTQGSYLIYTNSLGIQQGYTRTGDTNWILLTANTNMINSSTNTLVMSNTGQGHLTFLSNESFTLQVDFDFSRVELTGDSGNVKRGIDNGSTHPVSAGNTVSVYWSVIIEPYIPYMFILGMIGLGAMFIGPIVAIKTIKENPKQALTMGVTLTALGIGLFMAWLGSG